jgi:hypothetical protein
MEPVETKVPDRGLVGELAGVGEGVAVGLLDGVADRVAAEAVGVASAIAEADDVAWVPPAAETSHAPAPTTSTSPIRANPTKMGILLRRVRGWA